MLKNTSRVSHHTQRDCPFSDTYCTHCLTCVKACLVCVQYTVTVDRVGSLTSVGSGEIHKTTVDLSQLPPVSQSSVSVMIITQSLKLLILNTVTLHKINTLTLSHHRVPPIESLHISGHRVSVSTSQPVASSTQSATRLTGVSVPRCT